MAGSKSIKLKDISDDLLNQDDEDQNTDDAITPVLTELAQEQGTLAAQFAKNKSGYNLSQSIKTALAKSTQKMSQNFTAETLDQLNTTLTEGITNGEGYKQLSQRVSDVYDTATDYRSDRVARTESQNAANSATLDAYQQNPAVTSMEWYANPDACPFCEDLDGTEVGLEDSFVSQGDSVDVGDDSYSADYGDVDTPPLHPNCECTIIPVTDSDGGDSDDSDDADDGDD